MRSGPFRFGVEHEVAFTRPAARAGGLADFTNTRFEELQEIVEGLPANGGDPGLRVDEVGIKVGRWYVEGFERFDERGRFVGCDPKGIEIRTPVAGSIGETVGTLKDLSMQLATAAAQQGLRPVTIAFNPFRPRYVPDPPLNPWEASKRAACPEDRTAHRHMVTYGPDLNLSRAGMTPGELVDVGRKLTACSPYLVPFSFNSPFFCGELWNGLSRRTHYRTGPRPAALVFVPDAGEMIPSRPSLTRVARIPSEAGRIEFKAFDAMDALGDLDLYGGLLALLKGLVLDGSLRGRRTVPDARLHRLSARLGFHSPHIFEGARRILAAARRALEGDPDQPRLDVLASMHRTKTSPADALIARYRQTRDIVSALGGETQPEEGCVLS